MTAWKELCAELLNGIELDVAHEGIENPDRFQALIARTRAALAQPEPPADGEVAELVAALEADAECVEVEHYDLCNMTAEQMRRAATLLQRLSAITTEDLKND